MRKTDKRTVLKMMVQVRKVVAEEIRRNLSTEGFAGGYLQAIDDITGALSHGFPSDRRGYWQEARQRIAAPRPPQ